MNESHADRATELWIARKPWLLKTSRVYAPVERHLTHDAVTDPAEAMRRAVAVGLAIGSALRSP